MIRVYSLIGASLKTSLCAVVLGLCLALPLSLSAQDGADSSAVEYTASFVSNYVFRGTNYFAGVAAQEEKAPSASTGAFAFQPNVTFYPDDKGWYFDIWASVALEKRSDVDLDGNHVTGFNTNVVGNLVRNTDEDNGLKRYDEVDYTLGYEKEARIGRIGYGLIVYSSVYFRQKASTEEGLNTSEVFVSYSPPGEFLSGFFVELYSQILSAALTPEEYYQFGYEYAYGVGGDAEVFFEIAAGYGISQTVSGWRDVTGSLGASAAGFTVSLNASGRQRSEFFDTGDSNPEDFKVADPESTTGEQKALPKTLMWLYLGYTAEL